MIEHMQIAALHAYDSPVAVLSLVEDADRFMGAVSVVSVLDTGDVVRERITDRAGAVFERIQAGAGDAVIWVRLLAS